MTVMPSCREVADALAADDLERRGTWSRLLIRWHVFRCRHCRRYLDQLQAIARAAREALGGPAEDPDALARLRDRILGDDQEPGRA